MDIKSRYTGFLNYFAKHNPNPETELNYKDDFQLLIAVILSARCTDKRVNMVTPELFKKYPNAKSLAYQDFNSVYDLIKSVTFPNNKTKYLIETANVLTEKYGGKVPKDVADLQQLAGVGRKTAHVISSVLYNEPNMVVDTHVERVSKRIGLVTQDAKTPLAVEKQLVNYIPRNLITKAHHWLILHGRYICKARNPLCETCPISRYCKYFEELIA